MKVLREEACAKELSSSELKYSDGYESSAELDVAKEEDESVRVQDTCLRSIGVPPGWSDEVWILLCARKCVNASIAIISSSSRHGFCGVKLGASGSDLQLTVRCAAMGWNPWPLFTASEHLGRERMLWASGVVSESSL